MAYNLITRNGYNMYDMASMLQKAIRRCDVDHAGFAAYELYESYNDYLWRRLLIISCEDCYGIMTKEIMALKQADEFINSKRKKSEKDPIALAKAVTLLCYARKNRDACYVACEFMLPDRSIDPMSIKAKDITKIKIEQELP